MSFKMINKTITTEQKLAFLRREITLCMEELPYAQGTRKEYITARLTTMARNMGELKGLTHVVDIQVYTKEEANMIQKWVYMHLCARKGINPFAGKDKA